MYTWIKPLILKALRCPLDPPSPPAGHEDSVYLFRAAPEFLRYRYVRFLVGGLVTLVLEIWGLTVMVVALGLWSLLPAALLAGGLFLKYIVLYLTIRLDYDMRYYIITNRSCRIREGVWRIRETTLSFANIQNLKIHQGPVQRLFGIYDLVVETAGGGAMQPDQENQTTHRGIFRGIKKPEALRETILGYLRKSRDSGLGDEDDSENRETETGAENVLEALRRLAHETKGLREEVTGT